MASRLVELGSPYLGQLYKMFSSLEEDVELPYPGGATRFFKARKISKKNPKHGVPARAFAIASGKKPVLFFRNKKDLEHYRKMHFDTRSALLDAPFRKSKKRGKSSGDLKELLSSDGWTPKKDVPPFIVALVGEKNVADKETLKKRYKKVKAKKKSGLKMSFGKKGKTKGTKFYISGTKKGSPYRKKLGQMFDLQEIGEYGKKKQKRRTALSRKKRMGQPWLDKFVPLRYEPLWIFGGNFAGAITVRITDMIFGERFGLSQAWSSGATTAALAGIQYFLVPSQNTKARSFVFGMILSSLASTVENIVELVTQKTENILRRTSVLTGIQQNRARGGPMSTMAGLRRGSQKPYQERIGMRGSPTGLTDSNSFGGAITSPNLGALSEEQKQTLQYIKSAYNA